MKDELITYETAILAKEVGFNLQGKTGIKEPVQKYENRISFYFPVTQSLLQRWLREEHKIDIHAAPSKSGYWFEVLYNNNLGNFDEISNDEIYDTYELALEAGLFNALELCK